MKHIKVTFGKKVYEHDIPTRWDELDAEGLKLAARIWSGAVPRDVLLAQFFGLPDKVVESIDDYLVYCLMQLTTWLQRLDDDVDNFKIEQLPDTEYLSPGPRLRGCTLEQFMIADTNFQRYSISQDADHLTYFIASLYNAKERSNNDMEQKIAAVEQLPEDVRQAVFLNFILIRRWLSRSYPHLFPPEQADDEEEEETDKQPKKPRPTDWLAIFDAFMGDDVAFIDRYKRLPALDAFRLMNRRIKQSRQPQ